jgi:FixJ family two-component response regulator
MEPSTISIIHGDDGVRASLQFLLEMQGYTVHAFRSPSEFLQSLAPGCLVLDHNLPGMTGLDLVEEIRRRGLGVPVVLTTTDTDARHLAGIAAAGVTAVDPLSPSELVEAVNRAVSTGTPPADTGDNR